MAEYLRIGIEVGLLEPTAAHAWADALVEALPQPSGEVIEVACSRNLAALHTSLRSVPGERDSRLAGQWLLGTLRDRLPLCGQGLARAIRQSLQVCVAAGLDEDTFHRFNVIDDQLSLARTGAHGTVAECRAGFTHALAEYPAPPSVLHFPKVCP